MGQMIQEIGQPFQRDAGRKDNTSGRGVGAAEEPDQLPVRTAADLESETVIGWQSTSH
jgi:hypothetical protein